MQFLFYSKAVITSAGSQQKVHKSHTISGKMPSKQLTKFVPITRVDIKLLGLKKWIKSNASDLTTRPRPRLLIQEINVLKKSKHSLRSKPKLNIYTGGL